MSDEAMAESGDEAVDMQKAAKAFSLLGASKGGRARAASLTSEERKEIAKRAVESRWAKAREESKLAEHIPLATHGSPDHPLDLGGIKVPCYVLSDESRVITHRGLQRSLGRGISGGARETAKFLAQFDRKGIDCKDLIARVSNPREFMPPVGGRTAFGYDGTILAEICDVVLAARKAGFLGDNDKRKKLADHCEILVRSFAKVGIIAMIDEATGYQEVRPKGDLERILKMYIAEELLPWSKRFPDEFYQQIYRLKGWEWQPDSSKRPRIISKITDDYVYSRLPDGVLDKLREENPVAYRDGSRRHRHHQLLSREIGNPHLEKQVVAVTTLLRISRDWHEFVEMFERSLPGAPHQRRLALEMEPAEPSATLGHSEFVNNAD
jgi:hypothetical protein